MEAKTLALFAAACAAGLAMPCSAQELRSPMTTLFMEIPLGGSSAREQAPNFGLQLEGSRPYQSLRIDERMFERLRFLPAIAGIEASWLVAGAVGVVAVASIAHKDGGTTQQMDAQKQQQAQQQAQADPCACTP